jgi:ribosomal-protein-alanine N-acetyltransferase
MCTAANSTADPRPLDLTDLEACRALDRLALGSLWEEDQWRRELLEPGRLCLGLDGSSGLEAMATGWLVIDELHITLVAVHPQHRRRGLGRRLLQALLERAHGLGAERATLEVAAGNSAARALYAAMGFRTAGRRRGYYRNGQDALIEWITLGPVEFG